MEESVATCRGWVVPARTGPAEAPESHKLDKSFGDGFDKVHSK